MSKSRSGSDTTMENASTASWGTRLRRSLPRSLPLGPTTRKANIPTGMKIGARPAILAMVTILVLLFGSTTPFATSAQSDTAPEQPSDLSTEAGDTQVMLSWADPEDSTIDKYQLWQIAESAKLTAAATTKFGFSATVIGDEAVVGMPEDDESNTKADSGAVLVFTRDSNGDWSQAAKLTASDAAADDKFGSSVAFDGATIVVGAPFNDHNSLDDPGSAYVFPKPSTGWTTGTEDAKLLASDAAAEDYFGRSVAVDGDTVVVGAYGRDVSTGVAYVFTKPSTDANSDGSIDWQDWGSLSDPGKATLTATLTAGGAESGDEFGYSVAIDGETVVVGASGDDGDALEFTGSAFVFVMPGSGGWVSTSTAAKLTASTRGDNDYFGRSVAIDGDTIVVGADEAENTIEGSQVKTGSAYVFTKPGTGWATDTETAKLTASDSAATDKFGYAVALDGDTVVVGAYGNDSSMGSAYVFTKPASGWDDGTEAAQLTASDRATNDRFASSVAVDGDTIVVGAENNDAAYVFDIVDWGDIAGSNATTTSHIVRRLTNDTEHTFRVRAVNTVGASDPSDYVSVTPKAAAYAPARPRNFSAAQTGAVQVELTWDAHRYPLTVTGYEYYQDDGGGPSWNDIDGSDYGTASYTVTGLTVGGVYTFAVRAINNAGSTESDSQSITVVDKPAVPVSFSALAGDGHVWLGWRNPLDSTITGYQYQQGTGDWTDIPGSTTFHVVTGLANGMSYDFKVRAVNAAGGSNPSVAPTANPVAASSAPAEPASFSAEQTGDGQVELTWDASTDRLSVVGYQYTQNGGSDWTPISRSNHSTDSHTITDLAVGNYKFGVRAVNSVGATASDYHPVTVFALPGAPSGLAATAGDTQVGLTWNDLGDASVNKFQLSQEIESIRLIANAPAQNNDELGWSVAVDGDTLVIGALGDDNDDPDILNVGAAYVFTRVGGGWTQAGKLTARDRKKDAGFGHAVAVHGDTIVVGAYEEDHTDDTDNLDDFGAAYVFTKPATGWADMTQTARLTASDAAANDEFGASVAVHGDTIVVGAPERGVGGDGSAYIFTKPGDAWTDSEETAELQAASVGNRFGRSVAVHGDTVVVGEPEINSRQGAAYVFTKPANGVWNSIDTDTATGNAAKLTSSVRGEGDFFGRSVAFDGETIVVGAPYDDDNRDSSGSAYVFIKPATGGWVTDTETAKLTASDPGKNDQFGISVAVDGDTVVVGADGGDSSRGSAYAITKPSADGGWGDWNTLPQTDSNDENKDSLTDKLTAYDRASGDQFGLSVAAGNGIILVGAPYTDDPNDSGSAYVFGTPAVWADIPGSGAATVAHIATGLLNDRKYTFQVRAVTAAGAGAASNSASATPKAAEAAPAAPATPSAEQTGDGLVELRWDAPTDPPTDPLTVTGYQYTQNGGSDWDAISDSDSATVSYTVSGLTEGATYSFAVRAVNNSAVDSNGVAIGASKSSTEVMVTIVAKPNAPTGLGATRRRHPGDGQLE